jgi:hypothetical protein
MFEEGQARFLAGMPVDLLRFLLVFMCYAHWHPCCLTYFFY